MSMSLNNNSFHTLSSNNIVTPDIRKINIQEQIVYFDKSECDLQTFIIRYSE